MAVTTIGLVYPNKAAADVKPAAAAAAGAKQEKAAQPAKRGAGK